jgi:hypothetical protein
MSNTFALDNEYTRVIPARFTTKRDGTAMACMTCGTDLVMGSTYAATGAAGGWHSYCARCAASYQAQVAGLVRRIEALVTPLGANVPTNITDAVTRAEVAINTVLGRTEPTVTQFLDAKNQLLAIRTAVGQAKLAAAGPVAAPVRTNGYGGKCGKCQAWVEPQMGRIEKQGGRWVAFHLDGQCPTVNVAAPLATVEQGLYLFNDGSVRKVYMTNNNRLAAKFLKIIEDGFNADGTIKRRGSFQFAPGGITKVREALDVGTAHLMTQEEAAKFGQEFSFCVNCGLYLNDDRSLAAGYGETCAKNKGWFYPNYAQAANILGRPTGPNGKPDRVFEAEVVEAEVVVTTFCEYCDEAISLKPVLNQDMGTWADLYVDHLGSETCSGDDAHGPDYHHKLV